MKTKVILLIIAVIVVVVTGIASFSLVPVGNYVSEGIGLTRFSDDQLQLLLKDPKLNGSLVIVPVTDYDLRDVPAIKTLIDQSMQKEFPVNQMGIISSDIDTLKSYHQFYATILAEKYSKEPEEFIRISPAHPVDLEFSPKAYNYEFDGAYFEYHGEQYGWPNNQFTDYGMDDPADIAVYKLREPLDPERHIWTTITDDDLKEMPLLKQAINSIGTIKENIEVISGLPNYQLEQYQRWNEQLSSHNGSAIVYPSVFEYKGEHFRLSFWIS